MKTVTLPGLGLIIAVAALCGQAVAGQVASAPRALGEIINPNFRIALQNHAADYDDLGRAEQIRAYAQVYRSLNNGENPLLPPSEAGYYTAPTVPYGSYFPIPPARYTNRRSGDVYTYVNGYGYRRTPGTRTPYSWYGNYGRLAARPYYGGVPAPTNYGLAGVPAMTGTRPMTLPVPPSQVGSTSDVGGTGGAAWEPPGGYGPPVAAPRHAPVPRAPEVHAGP